MQGFVCNLYEEAVDLYQKEYCTNHIPTTVIREIAMAKLMDDLVNNGEARHDMVTRKIREDFDIDERLGNAMSLGFLTSKLALRMQLDGLVDTDLDITKIKVNAKGKVLNSAKVRFIKATDTLKHMNMENIIDYYVKILG